MVVVRDTSTVGPAERAEYWVDVTSELFVPLTCKPRDPKGFNGKLAAGKIGAVQLCRIDASAHTIERTSQLVANTEGDYYKLSLMAAGEALVVQDKREAVLRPGDFAIYDCSRPYTIVGGNPFGMLVCMLPRDVVGLTPDRVATVTATRIPGGGGVAWALAPFLTRLTSLVNQPDTEALPGQHRLVEVVVELVEALCGTVITDEHRNLALSRSELMLRIRAYIEANLGDPQLSPTQIANAHYVSKRYFYKLLESEGITASRWIRERRLARCCEDLADPVRRNETVTNIGARWGITDSGHLSRIFREAYGCTPTEYRAEMLRTPPSAT